MMLEEENYFTTVEVCTLDRLPLDGCWAVLTKNIEDEERLRQLCAAMGNRLIVQETWKELLPDAALLISSAICGGNLETRFQEAAADRRCYLLLEPVKMRFPLPCLDGCGECCIEIMEGTHFYSDALCCYYTHTPEAMFLWDTEETLERKKQLAKDSGFLGIVKK